jgi:hypothetical protein
MATDRRSVISANPKGLHTSYLNAVPGKDYRSEQAQVYVASNGKTDLRIFGYLVLIFFIA